MLEALRGRCHAKLTAAINNNGRARNGRAADACDKSGILRSLLADTDCLVLASHTSVADLNVLIARGELSARIIAQSDVGVAACIVTERVLTGGRVGAAGCVANERVNTGGRIVVPGTVELQRRHAGGSIVVAGRIEVKRRRAGGCVGGAGGVAIERSDSGTRVVRASGVGKERMRTESGVITATVTDQRIITLDGVVDIIAGILAHRASRYWRRDPGARRHHEKPAPQPPLTPLRSHRS